MLQMLHVCGAKHYNHATYLNAAADTAFYKFETGLTCRRSYTMMNVGAGCSQLQTFQSRWVTSRAECC